MNKFIKKLFMILPILVVAALVAGFLPNILTLANPGGADRTEGNSTQPTVVATIDDRKMTQSQSSAQTPVTRITREEAREIALNKVDGEIVEFESDDDEYEIEIRANGKKYELEINIYTGIITEYKISDLKDGDKDKSTKPAATTSTTKAATSAKRSRISAEEARQIALEKVNGKIVEFELDDNKYEVEIRANGKKYEFEINAYTGKITEYEVDDLDDENDDRAKSTKPTATAPTTKAAASAKPSRISSEEARKIALSKVNGTIVEFELDDDEYQIEIHANGKEYEIEINANTGKITEFEVDDLDDDKDDRYDDDDHDHDGDDDHDGDHDDDGDHD